jgi:hypothetical protein
MSMKEESALALISQARQTTTTVREHERRVAHVLQRGRQVQSASVNGFGVFMEPQERIGDLIEARAEIEAALDKLRNTAWPSESDYREAGD